jgi:hypothetical protein
MSIKMKIVEVHQDQHSVVVRYYSDRVTEDMLAERIDGKIARRADGSPVRCSTDRNLNIWQVPAPTGQAMIDYIIRNYPAPRQWLELVEKIADPVADTTLSGVPVGVEFSVPSPEAAPAHRPSGSAVAEVGPISEVIVD